MADKVIIEVEARFNDHVTGKTKSADDSIQKLGKSADQTQKKLDNLGKNTRKVIIDGSADKLLKKLDSLDKKIAKITSGDKAVKLSAKDKATATILKIERAALKFANRTYRGMIAIRDSNALSTINKISNAASNLTRKSWQTVVTVKDMATAPLTKIKNMLFSIKSLALAITAGVAANQIVAKPIALADAYSGAQIGFSTLLGDSAGQQMMDDLDQFAKETPFGTSDVIAQTQRMLAMGWDAENIIEDMRILGDAAAATGKGTMGLEQIVTALAQIKSKGKLSTEELNQLAEAGISAKRYLAEGLGYGSGDEGLMKLSQDLEKGAIYSDEALQAIMAGMQEYSGMMEATANETVQGLKSQIADAFEISIFRRWGQGLQDGAKQGLGSVVELLNTAEDGLNSVGDLLYDLGSSISGFFADTFANAVERINNITDTFEFQNASLSEKLSMLWQGVVSDPLSDWWDKNEAKFAEKAGELGGKMGKMLSDGIKGILGIADVFDGTSLSESGGASIGQSFAKGFVDNFDASGIANKLVDAVASVWGALPGWAKVLVGGYAAGKVASGLGSVVNGFGTLIGAAGTAKAFIGSAGTAGSGLLGAGGKAAMAMGAGASLGAGSASLLGLGGIAGGVVGGYSLLSGIADMVSGAYTDDKTESKARTMSGGAKVGGTLSGAALGAAIGSIIPGLGTIAGGLIGAGIGGAVGAWKGGDMASDIRAAKAESEGLKSALKDSNASAEDLEEAFQKGIYENMKKNLGDIKLTASEIQRIADQIVWGDDLTAFDTFTQAQSQAEAAVQSLNDYGAAMDKWMWKASLGVKFNEDEVESIVEQFDGYIASAKQLVENKNYEFTAAVEMLLDEESAKGITESGNAFYLQLQEQLDSLGGELSSAVSIALEDGVITLDEQNEIANLQQQIAEITQKVADAEASAEMDLIKIKFGGGTLDMESFNSLMEQMQQTIDERVATNEDAFTVALSGLKLQLSEGALTQEEYNAQVQQLTEGYTATLDSIKAEVMGVELDIIADSNYGKMLGGDATAKLQTALEQALKEDIDPITWSPDEVRKILGAESLSEEAAGALGQMLSGIFKQVDALDVVDPMDLSRIIEGGIPDQVSKDVTIDVTPDVQTQLVEILREDFGIPESQAWTIIEQITGEKAIMNLIEVLGSEFGLKSSDVWDILWEITGNKKIMNQISLSPSDFGIKDTYTANITIAASAQIVGLPSERKSPVFKALGGVVGGDTIPGYASGGLTDSFGARMVTVGEEGPEMIIPLSSQRRNRALKLWAMAGHMMDIPGFAQGGVTDNSSQDEGYRFRAAPENKAPASAPSGSAQVNVGGISVQISVDASGGQNVAEAIQEQGAEIAETVAGILADALQVQFENTPTLGGA